MAASPTSSGLHTAGSSSASMEVEDSGQEGSACPAHPQQASQHSGRLRILLVSPRSGQTTSARPSCTRPARRRTSGYLQRGPPRQERTRCKYRTSPSQETSWVHPRHRRPSPGWCGTDTGPGKTALPAPTKVWYKPHVSMPCQLKVHRKYAEGSEQISGVGEIRLISGA